MLFRAPVRGILHPQAWRRPSGNKDFRVTQGFGCTGNPYEPPLGTCAHFHRAIDMGDGGCYAPILAAQAGTVINSYVMSDGNHAIVINHGSGWETGYGHLQARLVGRGAKVGKGQQIGTCGATGRATACHLHFAMKSGANPALNFWNDRGNGIWQNPWPRLEQNVTIRPTGPGVNIRLSAGSSTGLGTLYAITTPAGRIVRASDRLDLGPTSTWRKWGGGVAGASYVVNGVTDNDWDRIYLNGAYRYIARSLSQRSAT